MEIPSIGLVWNDKMNCFAQMIGCEDRYIKTDKLLEAEYTVNKLISILDKEYDTEKINALKVYTMETIKNIVDSV